MRLRQRLYLRGVWERAIIRKFGHHSCILWAQLRQTLAGLVRIEDREIQCPKNALQQLIGRSRWSGHSWLSNRVPVPVPLG